MFMLPTRLLPPQFLLPAWNSRQLAQAAQRAHISDHTKDNDSRRQAGRLSQEQAGRNIRRRLLRRGQTPNAVETDLTARRPERKGQRDGNQNVNRAPESDPKTQRDDGYETVFMQRKERNFGVKAFSISRVPRKSGLEGRHQPRANETETHSSDREPEQRLPRRSSAVAERQQPIANKTEKRYSDQEPDHGLEELSLFEELFPEEAMARQKRENKARERLEKLPAFNWAMDAKQLDAHDKRQQELRQKIKEKHQTIPGLNGEGRKIQPAKKIPQSSHTNQRMDQGQQEQSRTSRSRVSVLVLNACSKHLEESDFYRVGPRGNHIENWTSGILKIIPARDDVTLEPLGHYYLLFSSHAAARLYLDKTQRLLELSRSSEYYSKNSAYLRDDEDLDSMKRNFTLVPTGGRLSLRLLEPPHSRGVQWMIDAAGPASLVSKQDKSQHIVLFSTDREHIKHWDLENAIMDDGKRRNLHWKLAGPAKEVIVKLETSAASAGENGDSENANRSRRTSSQAFQGPGRYTIAFKDANEARRFAREWHRRPFPSSRQPRPEEDGPPTMNAEVLW